MILFSIENDPTLKKAAKFCVPVVCQPNQIKLYSPAHRHYRVSGKPNKDARIRTEVNKREQAI